MNRNAVIIICRINLERYFPRILQLVLFNQDCDFFIFCLFFKNSILPNILIVIAKPFRKKAAVWKWQNCLAPVVDYENSFVTLHLTLLQYAIPERERHKMSVRKRFQSFYYVFFRLASRLRLRSFAQLR